MVGGGGKDVLIGGPGRNVLIAGAGASKLYAAKAGTVVAATSGSILIGGTTNFDQNDSALEHHHARMGLQRRLCHPRLETPQRRVGSGILLNSTTVRQTVRVIDQLYASTGGYDWFMAPSVTDQMLGIDPHKKSLLAFN